MPQLVGLLDVSVHSLVEQSIYNTSIDVQEVALVYSLNSCVHRHSNALQRSLDQLRLLSHKHFDC